MIRTVYVKKQSVVLFFLSLFFTSLFFISLIIPALAAQSAMSQSIGATSSELTTSAKIILPNSIKLIEKVAGQREPLTIGYEKYRLNNGLTLILHQDNSDPLVHVDVTYHVGSAREHENRTGFAHFFEHMMFQGSKHVADQQHFQLITEVGGTTNGSTTSDRTNYFETVPADQLEKMLWLESDRMGYLLDALSLKKFEIQRDTVKNERRQNFDNRPYGLTYERLGQALYPKDHPYSWPTIGYPKDLNTMTVADLKAFFKRWYGPNNATLTIGGDFDKQQLLNWVDRYFASIPRGQQVEPMAKRPITLANNRFVTLEDNIKQPNLVMAWPAGDASQTNQASLSMLAQLLSNGKNSPFYQQLIKTQQVIDASAYFSCEELACTFYISALVQSGQPEKLSQSYHSIIAILDQFSKTPIAQDQFSALKNRHQASMIWNLQSVHSKVAKLAALQTFYDNPNYSLVLEKQWQDLQPEQVTASFNQFIYKKPSVALSVVPKNHVNYAAQPANFTIDPSIDYDETTAPSITSNISGAISSATEAATSLPLKAHANISEPLSAVNNTEEKRTEEHKTNVFHNLFSKFLSSDKTEEVQKVQISEAQKSVSQRVVPPTEQEISIKETDDSFRDSIPPSGAPIQIKIPTLYHATLENGFNFIATVSDELPVQYIQIVLPAGYLYEPKGKEGMASITADLMMESSNRRSAESINLALQNLGSSISFYATDSYTVVSVASLTKNLSATLDILYERLFEPKFDQKEFELVRQQAIDNLKYQAQQVGWLADQASSQILYGHSRLAIDPQGTVASLNRLTIDDIKDFYHKYYQPQQSNSAVIAVGSLDPKLIEQKVKLLAQWQSTEKRPLPTLDIAHFPKLDQAKIWLVDRPDAPQTQLLFVRHALPFDALGDQFQLQLANYSFSGTFFSRVNLNLREDKGYTYGVKGSFDGDQLIGTAELSTQVRKDATLDAIKQVLQEYDQYAKDGPNKKEIAFMRAAFFERDALSYETISQKAGLIGDLWQNKLDVSVIDKQKQLIQTIKPARLKELAHQWFQSKDYQLIVVGDAATLKEQLLSLKYPITILKIAP